MHHLQLALANLRNFNNHPDFSCEECLDAPWIIPAGSTHWPYDVKWRTDYGKYAPSSLVIRDGQTEEA